MNRLLTPERAEEIKQQANNLLSSYLHIQDPMERVTKIASDNGIGIFENMLFEISGALRKEGDRWVIYVNSTDSIERKLFTIAHELGHFFTHKDVCDEFVDGQLISRNEQEKYAALELEANEFAGNLIMPESEVRKRVTTEQITMETVQSLARSFGVSTIAMTTRLKNLGYDTSIPTTRAQAA